MKLGKDIFTTGQVAKMVGVAPRTVVRFVDSGELRGFRIPGSQDRRIPRDNLIRFLKEHDIPLGKLEDEGKTKILLVGTGSDIANRLRQLLPEGEQYKYEVAANAFEAGLSLGASAPWDVIVLDQAVGRGEALQIAQNLRGNPLYEQTLIIGLAGEDEAAPDSLVGYGCDEVFQKPFDIALLAERIARAKGE